MQKIIQKNIQNQTSGKQPAENNFGAVSLGVLVGVGVAILMVGAVFWNFPSASNQGYSPEQPIPYSHKLHAGKYKIACLYCHTNAERSAHATVPPLSICMNCHSIVKGDSPYIQTMKKAFAEGRPIEWVRVHELPDHVRFVHSRHVKAGLACQTCHGQVQEMERVYQFAPLTMGWCMECHRGQTTPKEVKTALVAAGSAKHYPEGHVAPTSCNVCHY